MHRKCKPQKQPLRYGRHEMQNCDNILNPRQIFHDNTHDIARTLVEILTMSGIHRCKANSAKDILLDAFLHYDEQRHGECNVAASTEKTYTKKTVIRSLGLKCLMTYAEALFTYSVMKQLLKAFFESVPKCGIRNYIMEAHRICEHQALWDRVARRIIELFKEYEYFLTPIVKNYCGEIKFTCKELFSRMKNRLDALDIPKPTRKLVSEPTYKKTMERSPSLSSFILVPECSYDCAINDNPPDGSCSDSASHSNVDRSPKHVPDNMVYPFEKFPHCLRCYAPKPFCTCNIDPVTGKVNLQCSQGPFRCEWFRIDKEYRVKRKHHVCHIDCWDMQSTLSASEVECTTAPMYFSDGDDSICDSSSDVEYFSENPDADKVCDEESTSIDLEPIMDGQEYCCHDPVVCREPVMLKDKVNPELEKKLLEEREEKKKLPPPSKKISPPKKKLVHKKVPRKSTLSHGSLDTKYKGDQPVGTRPYKPKFPPLPQREFDMREKSPDTGKEIGKKKEPDLRSEIDKRKESDRHKDHESELEIDGERGEIDVGIVGEKESDRGLVDPKDSYLGLIEEKDSYPGLIREKDSESGLKGEKDGDHERGEKPGRVEKPAEAIGPDDEPKESGEKLKESGEKPQESGKKQPEAGEKPQESGKKQPEAGEKPDGSKEQTKEQTEEQPNQIKKPGKDGKELDESGKEREPGEEREPGDGQVDEKGDEGKGEGTDGGKGEKVDKEPGESDQLEKDGRPDDKLEPQVSPKVSEDYSNENYLKENAEDNEYFEEEDNKFYGELEAEKESEDNEHGDRRRKSRNRKRKSRRSTAKKQQKTEEPDKLPDAQAPSAPSAPPEKSKIIPKKPKAKKKLPCCKNICKSKSDRSKSKQSKKKEIKWKCVVIKTRNRIVEAPSIC